METCQNRKCRKPFEPAFGQEETQKYCSPECGNRERVRRYWERRRLKPNGGPGGKRQAQLFSRSELHRRKPAKAALVAKPKQDDLFPPNEGRNLCVTFGGTVECAGDGTVSDNGTDYSKYYVKAIRRQRKLLSGAGVTFRCTSPQR